MSVADQLAARLRPKLELLYADRAGRSLERILALVGRYASKLPRQRKPVWDQRDVLLITYGDQVRSPGRTALAALREFLAAAGLDRAVSALHLLPFCPYSSDDGFSVIDYRAVDPGVGSWADVKALGEHYHLMFDLVLNHVSRQSPWFQQYLARREPYTRYFIEVDPAADLSMVARPRSLPLVTPVETQEGTRHVWTTFSDDQIDLNFAEPDVLVEMLDVLLFYLEQGARFLRLDAIAYLWKEPGTSCIHLPQTHAVVKLMRDLVDAVSPGTVLLTETNVPHRDNVGYFGDGDEAHMVYQFSLAALLLEALITGDADLLTGWLAGLGPTPPGTTVLNFTASHDGVGVRPLEGIMPPDRFERLLDAVRTRGGLVSTKRNPDGTDSPYELNISYFSALRDPNDPDDSQAVRRFMASQALMVALRGIPGVYFHSLVATPNDTAGVKRTGRARSINRRKFELEELRETLAAPDRAPALVLDAYRRLLAVRTGQPAFHPEAPQEVVGFGDPAVVGFTRTSLDGSQRLLVVANVGSAPKTIDFRKAVGAEPRADLLARSGSGEIAAGPLTLLPYQVAWLELQQHHLRDA